VQGDFPVDPGDKRLFEEFGRRQEFPVVPFGGIAGSQVIEQFGYILTGFFITGEQPQVAVEPGGAVVVVAGAEVEVAPQGVVVLADYHDYLAVGFEPHHPVGYMNAGLFHPLCQADVGGLVEAGLQLYHHRHLFAVFGGIDEEIDDAAVCRRAVEGHFDGPHLGIICRFLKKALHRGAEGFIGMLQQYCSGIADNMEDAAGAQQLRMVNRLVRRLLEVGIIE